MTPRPSHVLLAIVTLGTLVACRGTAAPLDARVRSELYDRSERPFASAVLARPAGETDDLAPLLLHEEGTTLPRPPADVRALRTEIVLQGQQLTQWLYLWSYPGSRFYRGLRLTLAADGFPAIYEVLGDSSGARPIFVSTALEEAAAAEFGAPCPERRFAVERPLDQAPSVVVPALVDPGPQPLGPFVYLTDPARDVSSLRCRCMPSLVERVNTSVEYRLVRLPSYDAFDAGARRWLERDPAPALDAVLRLPPGSLAD